MNKYRVEYCEENGFTKIYPENTEIKGYVKYLEDKLNKTEAELKLLNLRFVSNNEVTVCDKCDDDGWIRMVRGDVMSHKLCTCSKAK